MVTKETVNSERVYYNYQGHIPPIALDPEAADVEAGHAEPKLITDTTLRDGVQASRFPSCPNEDRLRYVDLLHDLDNGTGRITAIETFSYHKRAAWVLDRLLERGYQYPQITTWIRAHTKDVKELYNMTQ